MLQRMLDVSLFIQTVAASWPLFSIPGKRKKRKVIEASTRKNHDSGAADGHLFALLHRSVWHQHTSTFTSSGSGKQVSL